MSPVGWPCEHCRRASWHEAAHAVVAWRFGHRLQIVSLRAGERFNGFATYELLTHSTNERDALQLVAFRPEGPTRWIEAVIVITLSGAMAETLAGPLAEDTAHPAAELDAAEPRSRHFELHSGEKAIGQSDTTDTLAVSRLAHALALDEVDTYMAWLAQVAGRAVRQDKQVIAALADALFERPVLSGERAVELIESAVIAARQEARIPSLMKYPAKALWADTVYRAVPLFASPVGHSSAVVDPGPLPRGIQRR